MKLLFNMLLAMALSQAAVHAETLSDLRAKTAALNEQIFHTEAALEAAREAAVVADATAVERERKLVSLEASLQALINATMPYPPDRAEKLETLQSSVELARVQLIKAKEDLALKAAAIVECKVDFLRLRKEFWKTQNELLAMIDTHLQVVDEKTTATIAMIDRQEAKIDQLDATSKMHGGRINAVDDRVTIQGSRIAAVEKDVQLLRQDFETFRNEARTRLGELDGLTFKQAEALAEYMKSVDRRMATLATNEEVSALKQQVDGILTAYKKAAPARTVPVPPQPEKRYYHKPHVNYYRCYWDPYWRSYRYRAY